MCANVLLTERSGRLHLNSICSTQILASKYHFPMKETNASWRNGWFQGWGRESSRWAQNIFFRAESKEAKRMMRHAKKMPESSLKSSHLSIEINHENKALQLSLEQCRFELCGFTYTWIFFFYWPAHFKSKLFNGQLEVGSLHIWKADLLYTEFWLHGR